MSFKLVDRVREATVSPGTGTATLAGAALGYQTFSAGVGANNTTYYVIADQSGPNWEVGYGTVGAGGTTLARTTVLSSSNAGSLVNFASGTQDVWVDYPATKAVFQDSTGTVSVPVLLTTSTTSTTPNLSFNASNTSFASGATVSGNYLQFLLQNKSGTAVASTNYVLSNDLGTDSTYYGEFGMNSSVFSASTPSDFFSINNSVYFSAHDGDVIVGSGNGFKNYFAWGTTGQSAHVINASGALGFSTNLGTTPALSGTTGYGTAGQVPVSAGSAGAVAWSSTPTLTGTNFTGIPISTGISGLGTGIATWLTTPSSANLLAAMTDETGTGSLVFATSPTLVTPLLGTPTSGNLSNCTNIPAGQLTGTIPSGVLGNSTLYVGTTAIALNRASANLALTGLLSGTFQGSTSGSVQLIPAAVAGTGTVLTMPATTGTIITSGDSSTVTNTMLAGSIANTKLLNSSITINGNSVSLGGSTTVTATATNALTISSPLSGTSYNGSAAVTLALAAGYGDTQNPFASKTANYFLAAPNGSSGAPTFRAIVAADIPTLNQNTTGTAGSVSGWNNPSTTANGSVWPALLGVKSDGAMEIGRYLDFHNASNEGIDYSVRLDTGGTTNSLYLTGSGIASTLMVTLNQYTNGMSSGSGSYLKTPIGQLMQWGFFTYTGGTNSSQNFNFPITFPTTVTCLVVSVANQFGDHNGSLINNSTFNFRWGTSGTPNVYYFAVGY